MEQDAPNQSHAHADPISPPGPSWNPALRPDSQSSQSQSPAAHELQPSPQIIPQSKPALEDGHEDDEDDMPAISEAEATPAHMSNGEDFFDRHEESEESESAQLSSNEASASGEDDSDENALAAAAGPEHTAAAFVDGHPEDHYEHQGETTLLEKAVAESENAPLVQDAEPLTDDWGSSGEVFDLGGMPQDAPVESPFQPPMITPHPEAGGTTVGDEVIGNTTVGGNTGEDTDDWGNGDGDDFFGGAIADQAMEPAQSTEEGAGAHVVQKTEETGAAGDDSVWDLDMDDDFLPDNEEAAPVFELDDDEGFLEDEPSQQPVQPVSAPTTNRYAPAAAQMTQPPANSYGAIPQPTSFSQPIQTPSIPTPSAIYSAYSQPAAQQQPPTRPGMPSSSESFAAKAREGYHSPYDLPEDIVTIRRRPAPRTASTSTVPPSAPPRSSSMSNQGGPPSNIPPSNLTPPSSGHSMHTQMTGLPPNASSKPAAPATAPSSDFFAELPVTTKPRPSGRYTPQHSSPQLPQGHGPPPPPKERTASWSSLRNEIRPDSDNLISQLQQPKQQLSMFPDQPTAPVRTNSLPVPQPASQPVSAPPSNRYSPAPAQAPSAPISNARYSPAPPSAPTANARYSPAPQLAQGPVSGQHTLPALSGPPRPPSQQNYLPRTSSPLAYHTTPQQSETPAHVQEHAAHPRRALEGVSEVDEQTQHQVPPPPMSVRSATPPIRSTPPSTVTSPKKRINYAPQYQSTNPSAASALPRAESPTATLKQPVRSLSNFEPPAPAFGTAYHPAHNAASTPQNVNAIPRRQVSFQQYECIAPTDERAADPLERWRGYPIFRWGLGGTVVTTFPNQVPRYGGGASAPMVKCSPGEIRIQSAKEILPLPEEITKFPGPLKTKSKKKDVSTWLSQRIGVFEAHLQTPGLDQTLSAEELKRLEEKILLWKVLQVFIDNDGVLDGDAPVDDAVRKLFASEMELSESDGSLTTAADLVGRPRSNTTGMQADPVDAKAVEELRRLLTKGDREKAVWHAVDQGLWSHAMLLSSTLSKDIWKQVIQEFVQKQVKTIGGNNQALSMLYEIFAGNHEDCVDELVPASARAGFQMMSTDGVGSTQNALQGLEKWRESLALVLNNRSEGDSAALVSLGNLLASYGRVEAAHICFLFARSRAHINGVDDPGANIVLIGADHKRNPLDLGIDLEPILLTEIYEFGLSLSTQGGNHIIPHLQNYKLSHAYQLAGHGHRADAQAYCDAIAASMKATTRVSPYYNGSFVTMLDDLSKRLSQSPKDGSSSWISKPSMDKVSSSLLSKFNSFIAGDDEDAASNQSGGEAGPFAKIAGNTPTISPVQSSADLYGAYSGFGISAAAPSAPSNSRYAPSNAYAPRTSMESSRSKYEPQSGRPSLESNDTNMSMRAVSDSYTPSPQLPNSFTPSQPQLSPPVAHPSLSKSHSYSPLRSEYNASTPSYGSPFQPAPTGQESAPSFGGFQPSQPSFDDPAAEPSGFQPPSSTFEPHSYQPYQPNEEDGGSAEQTLKPKKSFMDMDDDDDDIAARAAALKSKSKSDADRQADEAFRKAAEEDAKRDKEAAAAKKSGGWFGGWFKKDDNAVPKAIKAKLGEENSFKYDPELKKWVNTKGGAPEASKPMATPPPPRSGPPGRSVSNIAGPPSSLPNGAGLPLPPTSNPTVRSSSMPPPMGAPGSRASTPGIPSDSEGPKMPPLQRPALATGPPSRPGTGMSTASSIDDLLGAPQARKGAAKGKKKGGRYVDVMAKP